MAVCARCGKSIFFSTNSEYCKDCKIQIATETADEIRKQRLEVLAQMKDIKQRISEEEKKQYHSEQEWKSLQDEIEKAETELTQEIALYSKAQKACNDEEKQLATITAARKAAKQRLERTIAKRKSEEEQLSKLIESRHLREDKLLKVEESRQSAYDLLEKTAAERKAIEVELQQAVESRHAIEKPHRTEEKEQQSVTVQSKAPGMQQHSSSATPHNTSGKSANHSQSTTVKKDMLKKSTPFVEQYYHGKIDQNRVIQLLQDGSADINGFWEDDGTAATFLSVAIHNHDKELVSHLISNDCDINVETYTSFTRDGQIWKVSDTPVTLAIKEGDFETAEILLQRGANINQQFQIGPVKTCLIGMLAGTIDAKTLSWLLAHGVDPNTETNMVGGIRSTPLYDAIRNGKPDNVIILLNAGANPDYIVHSDAADYSLLSYTILHNDLNSFNALLNAHADPNCRRISHVGGGDTPALCDAIAAGQIEMVQRLIQVGADVNCAISLNGQRFTALQCAMNSFDLRIAKLLMSHGAK